MSSSSLVIIAYLMVMYEKYDTTITEQLIAVLGTLIMAIMVYANHVKLFQKTQSN